VTVAYEPFKWTNDTSQSAVYVIRLLILENDKAVLRAYGFIKRDSDGKRHWMSENEVVSALIKMYEDLRQNIS